MVKTVQQNSDAPWTLQIKTVGDGVRDFTVELHPDDDMSRLYKEIHGVTGLRREQQRLIYRGRLLANETEEKCKVKDIRGLTNGHTIHLMRKQENQEQSAATIVPTGDDAGPSQQPERAPPSATSSSSSSSSAASSSSLLAALLGNERSRRVPFRLREEDLERSDPGSMEPVRQGLMTLRTMQQGRRFYVGQWIDCRDTVNQWLEATIVAILEPHEVLHSDRVERNPTTCASPTFDATVTATDLEGRRKLLLEPCEEAEAEEQIDGVHYRPRSNNTNVQLLHIHYNGWPVRWDEWIRSDSERIRAFRVRTRHPNQRASPTVQSTMASPPNTKLTDSEANDREAVLPELIAAMETIQHRLRQATNHDNSHRTRQRELAALAPLLDRLGRTLTDCAPHVANLSANLPEPGALETIEEHPSTLGGLLSLLSRDRRPRQESVSSTAAAMQTNDVSVSVASSTTGNLDGTLDEEEEEDEEMVDPDLSDYMAGMVNTTRGEVRNGPRREPDASNILGAYLAAASMAEDGSDVGRLLRGTGGIDIHIHAVVTAPGLEGAPTPIASVESPRRRPRPAIPLLPPESNTDDDEDGIFSDLYSETPEPVDPSTPPRREPEPAETEPSSEGRRRPSRRSGMMRFFRRMDG